MPTLPLPAGGCAIDGGDLPVSSAADVAAAWAAMFTNADGSPSPLLAAIQAGQAALLLAYQDDARYAAAQSDPTRATDEYQDECGEERSCFRQPGETSTAYRARMFARPAVVSPNAIIAAANAILAPYTSTSCRYAEHSDGLFLQDGTMPWSAHLFNEAAYGPSAHTVPNYPDRLYPDAAAAGLPSIPNRRPPGAMLNGDSYGRWFLLRVPDISVLDTNIAAVFDGGAEELPSDGLFLGNGTTLTDQNASFLFSYATASVDAVYNALIGAVTTIVGTGVRWDLIVDPNLAP